MRITAAAVASVLVCAAAASGRAQTPTSKPPPRFGTLPGEEMVHIDGSRNPELIPQWAIWEHAFRVIAGGTKALPSAVHHVVSSDEEAVIVAEAEANGRRDAACQARMLALRSLVMTEPADVINAKQREIQIDCRWGTLQARDRLLERLRPEGRAALTEFVESIKAGTKVTVSRRELAHYLRPQ